MTAGWLDRRRLLRGAALGAATGLVPGLARAAQATLPLSGALRPSLPAEADGALEPRLRRGVSTWPWFALTREFPAPRVDYDWPPFQPARSIPGARDLARLAAAGFDFIRLPVDPGPFLAFTGAEREALFAMLAAAVTAARRAGLAVLVNLQPNDATHHWTSRRLYGDSESPDFAAYRALVASVAGRLYRLAGEPGPGLALEPVNEPPQACGAAAWALAQQDFLTAARAAAPGLLLVATGACGSMVPGLEQLDARPLLPLAPLRVTVHYYEPYLFSHQGAPWMREPVYRWLNSVPWPGAAGSLADTLAAVRRRMAADPAASPDEAARIYALTEAKLTEYFAARPDAGFVRRGLERVAAWADAAGLQRAQVLLGEFGAVKTGGSIAAARPDDRVRYIRDVRQAAEACGFGWAFWNLFDSMGLMDDATRQFDPAVMEALGLSAPS